ncbi:MAG: septal ring lytic transglycosylase RlpA family protein [Bacteroidia bacterium]
MAKASYKYALLFLLQLALLFKLQAQELADTLKIAAIDPIAISDTLSMPYTDSGLVIKKGFTQIGRASYYANKFQGRKTASGERYSHHKYTAAHKRLKFGTLVKVTNLKTGTWVIVKINDRGPYSKKFIIDLSLIAARKLNLVRSNAKVKIEVIGKKKAP